jgi:hypothetical protein
VVLGGRPRPAGAARPACRHALLSEACSWWGVALRVTRRRPARGGAVTPAKQRITWRSAPAVVLLRLMSAEQLTSLCCVICRTS